jgi:hypothetical protein
MAAADLATLVTKYGPTELATAEAAAGQLEAYARITRAALEARDGPLRAPVLLLSDEQLAGLFAPRQLAALIKRRLARNPRTCE